MKNMIKTPGIVALFLLTLFACNEDFLDRPAQGNLDAVTLANQAGVEGNLIAAYAVLDGGIADANSNWVFGSVASDDAYKGSEPGDNQTSQDIEAYQWSTSSADGGMAGKWSNQYEGISRANATINLLNTVEGISTDDQNWIRGEALFLRAFYHFELYKVFGHVPYYTEEDTISGRPTWAWMSWPFACRHQRCRGPSARDPGSRGTGEQVDCQIPQGKNAGLCRRLVRCPDHPHRCVRERSLRPGRKLPLCL
ncbi:MAG: RagB/SusD family nutrient uptake outer membrane protein [Bacteroidales bacterium]